ncbi:ornithine cyclodeaminase family protein [Nakamurella leprariae]|uniref:Ornithine cyclodeaminase family protein n=1 Tax=Nakamurella leprariae TaxID=2803911 RepID=A0A939C1B7_9ACTN|nr:ornithine cyclodeaminase family protein [Nakamurella leprariae]MBM9469646.1 ornithine cyclodeaminase family protein [Nakamurella leprariae]
MPTQLDAGPTVLTAGPTEVLAVAARDAVEVMRGAVVAHATGELHAPVRQEVRAGDGAFILTAGRLAGVATGFRVGNPLPEGTGEATVVFTGPSGGDTVGLVVGRDLGRRRTGALGGVAADLCSRPDATVIGFVGAGEQAFTQLWAIAAVRPLTAVRVWSRSIDTAQAFAVRATAELGLPAEVVATAEDAVRAADIVVMATPSCTPLVESTWLAPGTHVHTLGPKGTAEGECPHALVDAADLLVSDSPDQLAAMEGSRERGTSERGSRPSDMENAGDVADRPWTRGRPATSLGEIATGRVPGRAGADDITLYASVGLAGTEVLLARHVLRLS